MEINRGDAVSWIKFVWIIKKLIVLFVMIVLLGSCEIGNILMVFFFTRLDIYKRY